MKSFLIDPRGFGDTLSSVLDEIKNLDSEYFLMDYRPFEATEIEPLREWVTGRKPIFFGSIGAARWLQRNVPEVVVLADFKSFECTSYYPRIGDLLWNDKYVMLPFGDIRRQSDFLTEVFGKDWFIRPNDGLKSFTGSVICGDRIARDLAYFSQCEYVRANTLCIIAPYNLPYTEYRCWIANGMVVTTSRYRCNGLLAETEYAPLSVLEFAKEAATRLPFEEPYVLDIATSHLAENTDGKHGKIKIVEANSFSCSGFYAASTKAILQSSIDFVSKGYE